MTGVLAADLGGTKCRFAFVTDDGFVRMRIQALVVESRERCIVVDTCLGNDKVRTKEFFHQLQTPFLADFVAAKPGSRRR